ncbi:proton-conducting transporter transmembrane domain-containing protein [Brevirhabdus sp.]|uniref:proton-conducting transporter transmembrane domain-containing protein n=1 Tax=Brevirhabdus sp. TaxID=2004514 RepID=UPI004059F310
MIWLLTLLPALGGLALWALAARLPAEQQREAMARAVIGGAAVVICLATLGVALALALAPDSAQGQFDWAPGLPLLARLTPGAAMIAVLTPLVGTCVVAFASMHQEAQGLARLTGLLLVFMGAMELVVMAGDLVTLLIGWEIMGACSWALIGHEWRKRGAMGSGGYAFVMTRGGDLGLYAALIATFAATGRADYAALGQLDGAAQAIAGFGLLLAAASKAGQLPFSPWLMRAMAGPTSVSALLHSSTMVAAGAFLMARLHVYLAPVPGLGATLVAVGLGTALAGGVVAVVQLHAKKVLAASTSAQLGLMFAAVGAGYPGVALLHLVIHALFKTPLFFAAGMAHEVAESYDMRRMGVGRALPWVPWLSLPVALALAGAPPWAAAGPRRRSSRHSHICPPGWRPRACWWAVCLRPMPRVFS